MVHHLPELGRKAGGVTVSAQRLAREIASRDEHQVTVGCLRGEAAEGCNFEVWHPIGTGFFARFCETLPGILFVYPLILNFVRFPECDVIHFHGEDWFLSKAPAPWLRTMHGAAIREQRYTKKRARKVILKFAHFLEKISAKRCDRLLCVGSDTKEIFDGRYSIGNGFDPKLFYPGVKEDRPVIFFNGYWDGRKRGKFLYHVFVSFVLPRIPNAELWFVGDKCIDHPQVRFFQGATDTVLAELYRRAWVFAYPSLYEGFGMPYIEAMASGTAILTSPNSGARDVVERSRCGVLSDDSEFSNTLIELLTDEELRESYVENGLRHAEAFTNTAIGELYIRHYAALAKSEPV